MPASQSGKERENSLEFDVTVQLNTDTETEIDFDSNGCDFLVTLILSGHGYFTYDNFNSDARTNDGQLGNDFCQIKCNENSSCCNV